MSEKEGWGRTLSTFALVICLAFVALLFKAYLGGKFDSVQTLRTYVESFGMFAPVMLFLIQVLQVIVPVLPGFLGCAVGAIIFGCAGGFWINYLAISLGSICAFLLARRYGEDFVRDIFSHDRYIKWADRAAKSKSYIAFLMFIMIMPLFPDDFFCFFTGLSKMRLRKFALIVFLGKPWCILAYSFGFSVLII